MGTDRQQEGVSALAGLPLRSGWAGSWARRAGLTVLVAFCAAGLANVFGQADRRSVADGPEGARLVVDGPQRLRGGLMGRLRITVRADERIAAPRLVLGDGTVEQVTVNSVVPNPADEGETGGRWVLAYGPLPAGRPLTVRIQFQVDPLAAGRRDQSVEFRDGDRLLARVSRRLTVYP